MLSVFELHGLFDEEAEVEEMPARTRRSLSLSALGRSSVQEAGSQADQRDIARDVRNQLLGDLTLQLLRFQCQLEQWYFGFREHVADPELDPVLAQSLMEQSQRYYRQVSTDIMEALQLLQRAAEDDSQSKEEEEEVKCKDAAVQTQQSIEEEEEREQPQEKPSSTPTKKQKKVWWKRLFCGMFH